MLRDTLYRKFNIKTVYKAPKKSVLVKGTSFLWRYYAATAPHRIFPRWVHSKKGERLLPQRSPVPFVLGFSEPRLWVESQAIRYFEGDKFRELQMESHYYHPYRDPHVFARDCEGVLKLEHVLEQAGYSVHFNNPAEAGCVGPNLLLMEDALLFAMYRKLDAVVLLSTQGEYAPLPDRLRLMGIPTLVLGWDFVYPKAKSYVRWKTDSCLRRCCAHYVAMEKILDNDLNSKAPRGFFFQCEHPFSKGRNPRPKVAVGRDPHAPRRLN